MIRIYIYIYIYDGTIAIISDVYAGKIEKRVYPRNRFVMSVSTSDLSSQGNHLSSELLVKVQKLKF
jgi:hypothetical protein